MTTGRHATVIFLSLSSLIILQGRDNLAFHFGVVGSTAGGGSDGYCQGVTLIKHYLAISEPTFIRFHNGSPEDSIGEMLHEEEWGGRKWAAVCRDVSTV